MILKDVRIGNQRLILGDCLAVMPTLGRFDAVVTDPPYGIGKDGQKRTRGGHGGRKAHDEKDWDATRPPGKAFAQIFQCSDDQVIWGGNHFADLLPPSQGWLVWDKGQRISQSDGELAFSSRQGALRIMTLNRVALILETHANHFSVQGGDTTRHPTQKPVALMEWCLGFLPDAKTILDPFAGSGTTLVACQRMGRAGTGIELDPDYFDIACRRVDEAARQPDLLIPETRQAPVQGGLDL